jgi:hypothetical protein
MTDVVDAEISLEPIGPGKDIELSSETDLARQRLCNMHALRTSAPYPGCVALLFYVGGEMHLNPDATYSLNDVASFVSPIDDLDQRLMWAVTGGISSLVERKEDQCTISLHALALGNYRVDRQVYDFAETAFQAVCAMASGGVCIPQDYEPGTSENKFKGQKWGHGACHSKPFQPLPS